MKIYRIAHRNIIIELQPNHILSQTVKEYVTPKNVDTEKRDSIELENAEHYFGIGHRLDDWEEADLETEDDEYEYPPKDIIWVWMGNMVDYREMYDCDTNKTHGMIWGHDFTDKTYKGRYEPDTGRLSIVRPHEKRFRPIPSVVMRELESVFPNISDISIF
jgi:hypothetical protein